MEHRLRRLPVLFIALFLAGCADGYKQFYQPIPQSPQDAQSRQLVPFKGEPRIAISSGNAAEDYRRMFEDNYGPIGFSSFIGPAADQALALAQAKKVGAAVVVVSARYQNTVSGALPITTPTSQTSYSSGTVNAYGSGGFATGNYTGTTTTYGSQTSYIPYSVDRYDQMAIYFGPLERKGVGFRLIPLTAEQHQALGTNKGLKIDAIAKESPAFKADILPGDIVLEVNGHALYDSPSSSDVLVSVRGSMAEFLLVRNGVQIRKNVFVPATEW